MNKTFKKLTALFATSLFALGLTACNDKENAENRIEALQKNGTVRIGVFSDKPPFGYMDNQGKSQGFDVEIAKAIGKDLLGDENKVQYVLVALGVVSKDGAVITDVKQLEGKTLLVNKGTTADAYFSKNYPNIKLLKFEQNTETFEALRDGRGDALAHDNTLLFAWAKENPGFTAGIKNLGDQDFIAPAVKKGDTQLLNWLNDEIVKLGKNGTLKQAYNKTLLPIYGDTIKESDVLVDYAN
ncbi:transporter substrate-binding domain-containing protein [Avibacterium paragallinarum]|uniref:transporter substrate-binding domain-containing protein n=1 Tax=Avibacterium paragallinarum TaxID=728 RepID=UPI003978AF06